MTGYQASKSKDGTMTIHSVPIFVECVRGENKFTAEWIDVAVKKAELSAKEGYFPPLHVKHHNSTSDEVKAAGYFKIIGTKKITFKGAMSVAVLADLIITDPSVSEDILAKRLPYRSVEIFDVTKPGLDSLALLDHEAPYLELPMLMIHQLDDMSSVIKSTACAKIENPWLNTSRSDGSLVAFYRQGSSAHFFTDDTREPMKKQNQKDIASNFLATPFAADNEYEKNDKGDKKDDKGENMEDMAPVLDVASICKAIASGSISVSDMDAIKQAIEDAEGEKVEAPAEESSTANDPAKAMAPGEAMSGHKASMKMAMISGQLEAALAKIEARNRADSIREDVAVAMSKLDGRALGSNLLEKLTAFRSDHGSKAFAAYVSSMADAFSVYSPLDEEAASNFSSQSGGKANGVAMSYVGTGADAVSNAVKFSREWKDIYSRGSTKMSEEKYVSINMERLGISPTRSN